MAKVIYGFSNEYRFLSNFWPSPITFTILLPSFDGISKITAPTVEHAYQALKCVKPRDRDSILSAKTPGEAKKLGSKIRPRDDWDQVKMQIMHQLTHHKYTQNLDLAKLLMATGDAEIVEANWWGDTYWGVDRKTGKGDNRLGQLIMVIRADLIQTMDEVKQEQQERVNRILTRCDPSFYNLGIL